MTDELRTMNGSIIECRYDDHAEIWDFLRVRSDNQEPNTRLYTTGRFSSGMCSSFILLLTYILHVTKTLISFDKYRFQASSYAQNAAGGAGWDASDCVKKSIEIAKLWNSKLSFIDFFTLLFI